ncbi:hypothetical protein B0T26DRAFT_636695 [Lasiosphaeria miniovina]|uniref:RNase T2-like C-terminal domain-containing protein n=1 Tax=Lasiosphaeria miniovina TaxID=1954250 RepID=A0AA40B4T5_9PEZI|nr:uncharacterized protein B0T26DRAFT_636695 [Lasiosphaeria miniovina]KAK0727632.1 hypothetical protein B0T26DRAFT_636695 [Lasiosphaeria miniovina]
MAGLAAAAVEYVGFNGTGQIRTVWGYGDQYRADLGCLTAAGLWTADDSRCDIFDAVRFNASTFTLASSAGPCRVLGAEFTCAKGNEGYYFGLWPWGNSIAGVECLRWGQYGLMASSGRNPPLATDPPQEIHLTSYIEEGKYVWLAFGKVEGVSNH